MQHALEAVWAAGGGDEDGNRGRAVALAIAVQDFRELSRLDLVPSEQVRCFGFIICVFDLADSI